MQHRKVSTYNIIMDDDKLELKLEVVIGMYSAIDSKTRELAPQEIRSELRISRDSKIKTRFYILVSDRMAPHLLSAIQWQAESVHGTARSYFHKLQDQVISQMFGPQDAATTFNIRYEGKLI